MRARQAEAPAPRRRGQLPFSAVPEPPKPDAAFIGRCARCKAPLKLNVREKAHRAGRFLYEVMSGRYAGHELAWSDGEHVRVNCPKCGRPMHLERLGGVEKLEVPCDVRCLAATGSKCECGCGGANHGRWHLG